MKNFLLVFLAALSFSSAHAAGNLLFNSDFTGWDEARRVPDGWIRSTGSLEHSTESEEGSSSIRMMAVGSRGDHASIFQRNIAVQGEQTLSFHARVKTEGEGRAQALFRAFDAGGNDISPGRRWSEPLENRPDWSDLRWTFTTPAETKKILFVLHGKSDDNAPGSVWYDRVSLRREGITLVNDYLELFIDPAGGGGRIQSLKLKDGAGNDYVYWDRPMSPGGFAADIVPADKYPGVLRDALYEVTERDKSGRRAVLTHRPAGPEYAGLRVDKEYILPEEGSYADVRVSVANEGSVERVASLRVQNIMPAARGVFTYPSEDHMGMYDLREGTTEPGGWHLEDLSEGWIAFALPEEGRGVVFMFEEGETEKAFCWMSRNFNTVEWTYGEKVLSPGDSWSASYSIVPTASGLPVVTAGDGIIAGIMPLEMPLSGDAIMEVTAYGSPGEWVFRVETASGTEDYAFEGRPLFVERVELPWGGETLMDISFTAKSKDITRRAFLHEQARFVKGDMGLELPDIPDDEPDLAFEVASYFPFGGYLHGGYGGDAPERGPQHQLWRRSLRLLRRNYMNTVTGHLQMTQRGLSRAKQAGSDWYSEKLRKHDMRLMPRQQTFRFRDKDGGWVFIENITREQALEEWQKRGGADLELLKWYAENYNDIILAYDISDEPEERFIPWYMQMRSIFEEINPERPATPILQLYRLAYMPYVPVFFGDIYPIYSETHGGRDPWRVKRGTLEAVREARGEKPVWTMPQAFGWLRWAFPDEGETRYMAYAIFASGGKGMVYHGLVSSTAAWLVGGGYDGVFLNALGTWAKGWHVLGEVGEHLTAIAPAVMDYLPADDTGIIVECESIDLGRYRGPAITASVLRKNGAGESSLIVVQNQDTANGHSGRVVIPDGEMRGRVLYDLFKMEPVPSGVRGGADLNINLFLPGDARIFYLGEEKEVESVSKAVFKNRFLNEKAIFNIDLELAENNGAGTNEAVKFFAKAEDAFGRGDYKSAHRLVLKAQDEVNRIIESDLHLGQATLNAERARQLLSYATEIYGENMDIIVPPGLAEITSRGQRYPVGTGIRPAEVDELVEETAGLIKRLNQAEDRLYLGGASEVAEELFDIAYESGKHLSDVRAYFEK